MTRVRRFDAVLLLAIYVAAFFGAPAAHEAAGAEARHGLFDPHDPAVQAGTKGRDAPDHDFAACAVCQWTAATRAWSPTVAPPFLRPLSSARVSIALERVEGFAFRARPGARAPPLS